MNVTSIVQATGYARLHIWCLSQARMNLEGCGGRKGIRCKNGGTMEMGSLISPDGMASIRIVGVSASVILSCAIKSRRRFLLAPTQPEWSAVKRLCAQVHGKRFVYKFVCDLATTVGYSPAQIQQLIALSAAEVELHASGAISDDTDSATMKLERLREVLRTPGAVRRVDNRTLGSTVPIVVAPEDLIVDGTSWVPVRR